VISPRRQHRCPKPGRTTFPGPTGTTRVLTAIEFQPMNADHMRLQSVEPRA